MIQTNARGIRVLKNDQLKLLVILYLLLGGDGPAANLPEDKAEAVDVGGLEAVEGGRVQPLTEDLRGHVPPRTHPAPHTQGGVMLSDWMSIES